MAQDNVFNRLKRLFTGSVVIRKTDDNKLVVKDLNFSQQGLLSNFIDRYTKIVAGSRVGWGSKYAQGLNAKAAYEVARHELFRDYESQDTDPILSSALDIYSDESTITNVEGSPLPPQIGRAHV